MARRRSRRKRNPQGRQGPPGPQVSQQERPALVPWRLRVGGILDSLAAWAEANYAPAIAAHRAERFGDPPGPERADDLARAALDFCCTPGSADGTVSILRAFGDQAPGLEPEERENLRRWERERRRGVFVVQAARRDRLVLWDPLEGAPITLHLLEKRPEGQDLPPGSVATASFQPWQARLVAVGDVEGFSDPRALGLFREQTVASGAAWHEPPAAAPVPGRGGS
jgi:hypothetical protein